MTTQAAAGPDIARALIVAPLPSAARVLAVTARPGQESADLGGLVYAFRRSGASLSLLCLTRGESAGGSSGSAKAEAVRPWEVQTAASILKIHFVDHLIIGAAASSTDQPFFSFRQAGLF